jgi:hypothetical protein
MRPKEIRNRVRLDGLEELQEFLAGAGREEGGGMGDDVRVDMPRGFGELEPNG